MGREVAEAGKQRTPSSPHLGLCESGPCLWQLRGTASSWVLQELPGGVDPECEGMVVSCGLLPARQSSFIPQGKWEHQRLPPPMRFWKVVVAVRGAPRVLHQ